MTCLENTKTFCLLVTYKIFVILYIITVLMRIFFKKDIFTQNKVHAFINLCSLNVSLKTTDRNFFELYILVYRRSKGGVIGNNIATALLNSCQLQKSCCDLALGICSKSAQEKTFVLCD